MCLLRVGRWKHMKHGTGNPPAIVQVINGCTRQLRGKFFMDMKFLRFASLVGEDKVALLSKKHIMIFGLGGVGGYAAETVARSGVGKVTLVDFDTVNETNINRQLCATTRTIGKTKVSVIAERLLEINPDIEIVEKELNVFVEALKNVN